MDEETVLDRIEALVLMPADIVADNHAAAATDTPAGAHGSQPQESRRAQQPRPHPPARPAELVGYGPIDDNLARAITATAAWRRLLTDPVTDVGRTRYRPAASLADLAGARQPRCTFPGCPLPAGPCDLDHHRHRTDDSTTAADNLSPPCRRHHDTKDGQHGWTSHRNPDDTTTWTTPTGRTYTPHPDTHGDQATDTGRAPDRDPGPQPPDPPATEPGPPF